MANLVGIYIMLGLEKVKIKLINLETLCQKLKCNIAYSIILKSL